VGLSTLSVIEVLNYPQQQISYAHAPNVSADLLILVVAETVEISITRI
jgi:hypothetical protein